MNDKNIFTKKINPFVLKKRINNFFVTLIRTVLIICLCYLILAPLLKNIVVAFTYPLDLGLSTAVWVPTRLSVENWYVAYLVLHYKTSLPYTILHTAIITVLQTVCAAMAGYSFARLHFRFRDFFFVCVLLTIIVPVKIFMLPQYLYFKEFDILGIFRLITGAPLNLLNSSTSIYIMAAFGMGLKGGLFVYIFRQSFRGLPKALEEAAYIDGAGFIQTFTKIVIPSSVTAILTVCVLSFAWNWNDAYFIKLFDQRNTNHLMLAFTKAAASIDEAIAAISTQIPPNFAFLLKNPVYEDAISRVAALLVFLPLIIFFLIIQKKFVQGVERSGLVG
ncbi:carbohydrate ABC transporter permease [Treponema phagedenis]|uniref:sn-glycerol-3-phosphate transport system permease protein UgpE n=1 Tax=Treponema phagedenis TaxID=162 RepID=A0A0B7GZZ8_TREPH|nr:carbohydrate ABC transporter permease [Treponema phagedenis]EFW36603.1 ABC transporter, permease protein [Treponema phagedenis F0421]NVP23646.1 carbohydrate ABC transporter permease [Treponema phagedenis]QEJ94520.1 carbohydrate ABC transporter permease [Treponema phagedenis]QEJ98771.1 carbohydrate ABC transporter permease [Treponema phagedenis]QEK01598.1 carbohydrate ABC transporter permease [Treponema phagedenis]